MAQIIKHRRGSLESLSAVTSSLQKGEIVIASGSSNLTVTNGSSLVFAVPENGQVQATNRFLIGDSAPNTFSAGTYNGMVKGVPYYASGSATLYLLGSGGNDAINLEGNISNFSSSVATSINALSASIGGGSIGNSVTLLNSFTSSQESKNSTLATYTGSVDTKFTEIGVVSGSLISSASAAKTTNDSQDISIANLNTFSSSVNTKMTEIGVVSGSLISSASAAATAIADLEAVGLTYATTGSNTFQGNQVITGSMYITNDLIVYGSSSLFNVTASALDIGQNTIVLNTATPAVRFGGISVADSGSGAGASGSLFWDSLNNHWLYQHPSGSGETYNSARLIAGPENSGSLGNEAGLTRGKITLATSDDHISDSIIEQSTDNATISVGGNLIITGSVTATTFVGSIAATNGVVSGSSQIVISDTTGYTDFSGSISASIAAVVANVGSGVGVSITNLNSFTSSQESKNSTLATYTGSVDTKFTEIGVVSGSLIASASAAKITNDSQDVSISNLNSFTSSANTKFTEIGVVSGSLISSASAASISIAALNAYTSSNTSTTALNAFTASAITKFTEIGVVSGSLIASASNADSRLTTLEGTGTIQGLGTTNDVTFNKVTTAGDVIVGGDLVVQGNTVTLNTNNLVVEDKLITLASGSTNNATADGAGFEVAGTTASFKYNGTTNEFSSSVAVAANVTGSINIPGAGSSKRLAFRSAVGNIEFVVAPTNVGDIAQWDGTDFVMSNVIDGGSF
jgi:hypothetical protein